ncbi:MAG TPA: hypothetical protein VHO72_14390 [Bacteroidales bacterium]|nr:hypothetical protein [Bacteroidales bacterium]
MKIGNINEATIKAVAQKIEAKYPNARDITTNLTQVARFWTAADGTEEDFSVFCTENYLASDAERTQAMERIAKNFETIYGYFNRVTIGLKEPLHLDMGPITSIDNLFGGYDVSSHISEDFFNNRIAFYILLNYKFYTLAQKTALGDNWSRSQWAEARLAEFFNARVPSQLTLKYAEVNTKADSYISEYNIFMDHLVNDKGETLFPKDLKLITHWGLRDELKANYNKDLGLEKQEQIFAVMNHIIKQDIPADIINSGKYNWNPVSNKVYETGKEVSLSNEPNTRYQHLLDNFKALKAMDPYNPFFSTYIQRKFDSEMEIPLTDVEKLFDDLLSSPEVKKVATLIEKRIGRELRPFDIWYDGFKERNSVNTEELDQIIQQKYPTSKEFEADLPNILTKLGFTKEKATYIASKIQVDPSRGAGHAWGATMKGDKARLRTRVSAKGMDYKGFNIAMHELGHCVEQTLTLYDIDYYLLNGVPNTAFTEALAFIFQKRDLEVLGIKNTNKLKNDMMALDIFWSNYEIMGVSLVDIGVWKWLYAHPEATASELKEAVITIAKEVWNKYYAPVFGEKDQPILAIYSHMIDYPLYLPAYPIGHLIDFQIEKQIEGKNFGDEVMRIYSNGRIIPQKWMKEAVGEELSVKPLLESVDNALNKVSE